MGDRKGTAVKHFKVKAVYQLKTLGDLNVDQQDVIPEATSFFVAFYDQRRENVGTTKICFDICSQRTAIKKLTAVPYLKTLHVPLPRSRSMSIGHMCQQKYSALKPDPPAVEYAPDTDEG